MVLLNSGLRLDKIIPQVNHKITTGVGCLGSQNYSSGQISGRHRVLTRPILVSVSMLKVVYILSMFVVC